MQLLRLEFGIPLDSGLLVLPSFVCDCNSEYNHLIPVQNALYYQIPVDKGVRTLISQRNFP
jgi:hypothetical protein